MSSTRKCRRPRLRANGATDDIIHHIRISTDSEINAAVKLEGLV